MIRVNRTGEKKGGKRSMKKTEEKRREDSLKKIGLKWYSLADIFLKYDFLSNKIKSSFKVYILDIKSP